MSDQIHLLRHGIPVEVAVVLAVIFLGALAGVVAAARSREGGERILRITAGVLCVLGMFIAGYVIYTSVILNEVPQCVGGGGGCAVVEKSQYSKILGVHISIFGLLGYLAILGATIWRGDLARVAAFVFSLFGFGFSLYLTYLELWEIMAICQWCVTSAVIMTMLFVVNTSRALRFFGLDEVPETNE